MSTNCPVAGFGRGSERLRPALSQARSVRVNTSMGARNCAPAASKRAAATIIRSVGLSGSDAGSSVSGRSRHPLGARRGDREPTRPSRETTVPPRSRGMRPVPIVGSGRTTAIVDLDRTCPRSRRGHSGGARGSTAAGRLEPCTARSPSLAHEP